MVWAWQDNGGKGKGSNGRKSTTAGHGWGSYHVCPCGSWAYHNKAGRCCQDCGRPWDKTGSSRQVVQSAPPASGPSSAAAAASPMPATFDVSHFSPEEWATVAAWKTLCDKAGHPPSMPRPWTAKLQEDEIARQGGPTADQLYDVMGKAKSKATAAKQKHERSAAALEQARAALEAAEAEHANNKEAKDTADNELLAAEAAFLAKKRAAPTAEDMGRHPPPPTQHEPMETVQPTADEMEDEEVRSAVEAAKRYQDALAAAVAKKRRKQTDLDLGGGGDGASAAAAAVAPTPPSG